MEFGFYRPKHVHNCELSVSSVHVQFCRGDVNGPLRFLRHFDILGLPLVYDI